MKRRDPERAIQESKRVFDLLLSAREDLREFVNKKALRSIDGVERLVEDFLNGRQEFENYRAKFVGPQSFPDILITTRNGENVAGVEIKATLAGSPAPGNSVISVTSLSVHNLYFFQVLLIHFDYTIQKRVKIADIRVDYYFDTVTSVKITHSPRFYLEFGAQAKPIVQHILGTGKKIRDLITSGDTQSLLELSKWFEDEKRLLKMLKILFSKERDRLPAWLREFINAANDQLISLLSGEVEEVVIDMDKKLQAEGFVWTPQLLNPRSPQKYKPFLRYIMVRKHKIPPSNLRDYFTSGGKYKHRGFVCPKVVKVFLDCEKEVIETWLEIIKDENQKNELIKYWDDFGLKVDRNQISKDPLKILDFWKQYIIKLYGDEECLDILRSHLEHIGRSIAAAIANNHQAS